MTYPVRELSRAEFPPLLREIPDAPKTLYARGTLPPPHLKLLAVVGSRRYSSYGKQVVDYLLSGLASYPIGIISGLALGTDALAHEAALKYSLYTLAVPGSGLDPSVIAPATNRPLAARILEAGGGLLSEYSPFTKAATWTFPQRNRIMAGLTHATLLIEAGERSGTLITARLATEYNRELLAVPGDIFSHNSYGVHQFIKLGATVVTEPEDILYALRIEPEEVAAKTLPLLSPLETRVLQLLLEPKERDTLIRELGLPPDEVNQLLMLMEIAGYIRYEAPFYRAHI